MKRSLSFSLIALLLGMFCFSGVATAAYIIPPVADTIANVTAVDEGMENFTTLKTALLGDVTMSFLRFDLNSIPGTITSATLYAYQYQGGVFEVGSNTHPGTDLYFVANDSWAETGMTWDSKPAYSSFLGSNPDPAEHRDWSSWALDLNAAGLLIDRIWSMALLEQALSGGLLLSEHDFYSKEYGNNLDPENPDPPDAYLYRPYLLVEALPVPVPSAMILLGSGLAGLAGIRRFWFRGADAGRASGRA